MLWQSNPAPEEHVTLYSFRHTAAIDIYTRTGSLSKLQKAMGHSNLNVSLTYLRGLDVAELKEADMPKLMFKNKIIQQGGGCKIK